MEDNDRLPFGEDGRPPQRPPGGAMQPLVVAAIVIAGLYFARPILEPLAIAVLLSLLLAPAARWLHQRGLGRVPAVAVTVFLAAIVILGIAAAVGDQGINLARELPRYEQNIAAKIRSLNGAVPGVLGRATRVFRDLGEELAPAAAIGSGATQAPVPVEIRQPEPRPLELFRNIAWPLLPPLASAGLVLLFVVMILVQREDLRDRLLRLAGARDLQRTTAAMNEAAERVSNYLSMQLAVGLSFGLPVGIGLAAIGIPNAPLWGMLGVALRFMPYLGGPLTAVFPIILAIAVAPGWGLLLWTVLLFVAIELVVANIVEPWVYGRSTGLSAVAVIAAAAFWAWLWGVVGLLLATPLTVCLAVLGRYVPSLRFLDVLLGNRPVLSAEESLYQRLLARDPEDAAEQAEDYVEAHSFEAFCDDVAVPALLLAQADSDRGVLAAQRRAVVAAGFAAMLDNLADDRAAEPADVATSGAGVACLAGRNELDLAAAWLLRDLLRRRGLRAVALPPDAVASFLPGDRALREPTVDRLPFDGAAVICLSLLSTGSTARARYLVRRIRRRARRARLVIGFWGRSGADFSVGEAVAATAADSVVSSLAAAVAEIEAALREGRAPPLPAGQRAPPSIVHAKV